MKETELINPEFNKLVTDFENALINEKSNPTDTISYLKEFFAYAEQQGIESLKEINQNVVNKYITFLEQERINIRRGGILSTGTVNKQKLAIRKLWKYFETEKVKVNPIKLRVKKYEKKLPAVLSHEEIGWLFSITDNSAFGYRDRCMLAIYYGCGLRRKEGLKLNVTDIDFGRGRILVRKSKNKRERYADMTPRVQLFIEEYVYQARDFYLAEGSQYEQLFIGERGTPLGYVSIKKRIEALWQRVKEKYNTDKEMIGLHALRHSLGTHLYMVGVDVEKIALMLGHRTLEATQLYIHSANQLKQRRKEHEQV